MDRKRGGEKQSTISPREIHLRDDDIQRPRLQASLLIVSLLTLGWISLFLYKVVVD